MRTVSIFKNGTDQVVSIPADMAYVGIRELEIFREGDVITLRPVRPSWASLSEQPRADADFLKERTVVVPDQERFHL
ncbi:MAG: type II toxin-antitoxin system VapB family antitoxin [Oleiphilaceae bacterium]|nr:type II toxin-antitoxin system VapB family antitoxin [Oleiphilaceae bacterium]